MLRVAPMPRTKEQLKLKWDNLKKAARKRSQQIRMNNLKTGGGKPDFIPADDILEKVAGLLGSTCTGLVVPFGGDGVSCGNIMVLNANDVLDIGQDSNINETTDANEARVYVPDDVEHLYETPSKGVQDRKRKIVLNEENSPASSSKNFFGMPMSGELKTIKKGKRKADNDGRLARNLAIARYYNKRSEQIDLENRLLRIQLLEKENKNFVNK